MNHIPYYADMALLAAMFIIGVGYFNRIQVRFTSVIRAVPVAIVIACAAGLALAYVWPGDHRSLMAWMRAGLDIGMLQLVWSFTSGQLDRLHYVPRQFYCDVIEAVSLAETPEQFSQAQAAAKACMELAGADRRHEVREPGEAKLV